MTKLFLTLLGVMSGMVLAAFGQVHYLHDCRRGLRYLATDVGGIYKVIGFGSATAAAVVGKW